MTDRLQQTSGLELPLEGVILSRYLDSAERKQLLRRHSRDEVIQLHRGAYVESALWRYLSDGARHRAKALAVALHFGGDPVFCHLSAAAFWRLPQMGAWPPTPHVAGAKGSAARTAALVRHGLGIPQTVEAIDGLSVTTLAATVVDVAATVGFAHSVVLADAALRRCTHPVEGLPSAVVTREQLEWELQRIAPTHGASRARRVVEFADPRADRPGESMSRVSMHRAGIAPPQLQVSLRGVSGKDYTVDFFWPEVDVIGEFDGKYKYTDPAYMNGRNAQQVLYDEKIREDDLRAAAHGFTRWPWATAISPTVMRAHLVRVGIH